MEDKIEGIDELKNKTLVAAESLLSKLEGTISMPVFEQYEIDALKVLIEFHN